ncbi:hypothetical protein NYE70_14825 [Paenibacillus sp. FSL R5-0407]|uniref:hypothetical protein n=1 Tax=Paenibacillus sp. FSL R5-0407 TaxID=2975320 RepID=UPI0030F93C35
MNSLVINNSKCIVFNKEGELVVDSNLTNINSDKLQCGTTDIDSLKSLIDVLDKDSRVFILVNLREDLLHGNYLELAMSFLLENYLILDDWLVLVGRTGELTEDEWENNNKFKAELKQIFNHDEKKIQCNNEFNDINKLKNLITQKNIEILNRLKNEEEVLFKFKNAIFKYNELEAKYSNLNKKYNLLSNSKLGRLTLKYWKFKKRIPKDF